MPSRGSRNLTSTRVRNPRTSTSICPSRGHSAEWLTSLNKLLVLLGKRITHDTPLDDPDCSELTLSNMTHPEGTRTLCTLLSSLVAWNTGRLEICLVRQLLRLSRSIHDTGRTCKCTRSLRRNAQPQTQHRISRTMSGDETRDHAICITRTLARLCGSESSSK